MRLASSENDLHFLNLLRVFGQTEIIFRLTIIFAPTKYRKMPKSFFRNHFTPKQTEHKSSSSIHLFHYTTGFT